MIWRQTLVAGWPGVFSRKERFRQAYRESRDIVRQILPYVLIGVGIGAVIHGFVPQKLVTNYLTGSLAVPAAVMVGLTVYTNIMGVITGVESLLGKGLPIGTFIGFMVSVATLSIPQFVLLKKVMRIRLITVYALTLAAGITFLGLV